MKFPAEINELLFDKHTHAELYNLQEIVYREVDVLTLIRTAIGLYKEERPDNLRPDTGLGADQVKGLPK